ncbi:hypothetical protein [Shinella sp. JR1-6]|uniref:hypothetical protein n=1 Tax=Shinella sp. JR1-6 TaxID=2527671 RepID=UPI00102D6031|nr:hypothetical protein [Shinella sp. JR1-6]TAA55287.1 hypothetical protein EXZ48_24965 [Shinella sp. JR1-6]
MSKVTKFFGLGRQSSSDIAVALEKARADLTAAESAVETARTAYDAALLSETPAALRKLHDGITDASIEADRATAVIAKLEKQHAEALESEAADQRQRRYDDAKAASESAEKRLRREYPKAALQIRDLLAEVAAASLAVREANEDRPTGAPALAGPEHSRSQANLYQEVLSEDIADLWTEIDGATPIREDLQRHVRAHEKGRRGMMRDRSDTDENPMTYGVVQSEHGTLEVVLKRFRRTKFLPDAGGRHIGSLASEIVLPPLDADATPYWTPAYDAHDAARQAIAELKPAPKRPERVAEFSYSLAPKEAADV